MGTTLAEVKEQVLKYIPVMARPMVMFREKHPIHWTGVYADIEVPNNAPDMKPRWMIKLPEPMRQSAIQNLTCEEPPCEKQKTGSRFTGYRLMTSVSIPVFDKKNHTTIENLGMKSSASPELKHLKKVRIAELLGVAGTDVPIREIEKLTPPELLGVNGYSFAVNNNGYVLYHPDLRPMFQEILKPNYNSVDLAEVELVHDPKYDEPRHNDTELFRMRKEMVDQKEGMNRLTVKVHMDDMKRVTIREQNYFYHNISNTPFTLGIAFPSKYGQFRVTGGTEITRNKADAAKVFSSDRWKLHPDWVYCEYNYAGSNDRQFDSPENNMRHFLDRLSHEGVKFNWGSSRVRPLPTCAGNGGGFTADCPKCDKELVQALVLDGEITQIFDSQESRQDLFKEFGIELSFVATRSGLTRWEEHKEKNEFEMEEDYDYDPDNPKEPHFADLNNEATDEVWYKRAVEYHYNNPSSFVFSVPFDIGDTRPTLVTATHAIFKEENGQKAPAAVVGVHIDYDKFEKNFMKVTTGAEGHGYKTNTGEFLSCKNES